MCVDFIMWECVSGRLSRCRHCRHETAFLFPGMLIYLHLPPYLRQWVEHDFGDAEGVVRFPRGSAENDVLEHSLTTLPDGASPQLRGPEDMAIELPKFKTKDTDYYCYLTAPARKMLSHVIMVRFRIQLWHDLYRIEKLKCPITDVIYDWMERHGIENDERSWETIRQMFFRQRKKYAKEKSEKNQKKRSDIEGEN